MKIYVGNLSFRATDESLHELFSTYGEVTSAAILMDRMSGRSKGFGFVEMSDDSAANAAIAGLNETEFMERKIVVNEARPRVEGERPARKPYRGGGGGGYNRGGGGGYSNNRD
jgi:RNA recognition motif-containing protein